MRIKSLAIQESWCWCVSLIQTFTIETPSLKEYLKGVSETLVSDRKGVKVVRFPPDSSPETKLIRQRYLHASF